MWNLGGLFKKRNRLKSSDSHTELSDRGGAPGEPSPVSGARLVLPERNASCASMSPGPQTNQRSVSRPLDHFPTNPGPPLPPKNSNVFQPTMQVRPQPVIFPQLQADLKYPEAGAQIVHGGHYYDPRFGYVRTGSYYDQQIAAMTCGERQGSRQSTLSQDRSSGVHSMTRSRGNTLYEDSK